MDLPQVPSKTHKAVVPGGFVGLGCCAVRSTDSRRERFQRANPLNPLTGPCVSNCPYVLLSRPLETLLSQLMGDSPQLRCLASFLAMGALALVNTCLHHQTGATLSTYCEPGPVPEATTK